MALRRWSILSLLIVILVSSASCRLWTGPGQVVAGGDGPATAVELAVKDVAVDQKTLSNVLLLKEKDAERYLAMVIGDNEATAIALQLEKKAPRRPLTHDLLRTVITGLGGRVAWVTLTDFADDTYYASIVLHRDGQQIDIDARPSDAVALALRAQAKIYAERALLDKQGIRVPNREDKPKDIAPPRRAERGSEDADTSEGMLVSSRAPHR